MTGLRTESAWAHHSPSPPSYIPVAGTGLTDTLDFWQRTQNLAAYVRALYVHQHIVLRRIDALIQRHFPRANLTDAFLLEVCLFKRKSCYQKVERQTTRLLYFFANTMFYANSLSCKNILLVNKQIEQLNFLQYKQNPKQPVSKQNFAIMFLAQCIA